jgi:hypothetical protein
LTLAIKFREETTFVNDLGLGFHRTEDYARAFYINLGGLSDRAALEADRNAFAERLYDMQFEVLEGI